MLGAVLATSSVLACEGALKKLVHLRIGLMKFAVWASPLLRAIAFLIYVTAGL